MKKSRFIVLLMAVIIGATSVCFAQDNAKWWQNEKWRVGVNFDYRFRVHSDESQANKFDNYNLGANVSYRMNIGNMGFFFMPEGGLFYRRYSNFRNAAGGGPLHYTYYPCNGVGIVLRPMMGKMLFDFVSLQTGPSVDYQFILSGGNHEITRPYRWNFDWNFRLDFHISGPFSFYINYAQHLNKHNHHTSKYNYTYAYSNYLGGGVTYSF